MRTIVGTTTRGDTFEAYTDIDTNEIVYLDCYGDTLRWDNNPTNERLVKDMIKYITTMPPLNAKG